MSHRPSRSHSSLKAVVAAVALLAGGGTVAAINLGAATPALAQDQGAPQGPAGGHGGGRMGKMLMQLNLSDAQKTQIRGIMADARKQNQNVTDRDTRRANMKAAFAKVDTVLTPDQRTQLHTKLAAMRQQNQPQAH